jgi:hypothetical protein
MGKSSRRGKRGEASQAHRDSAAGQGLAGDSVAGEAVAAVRPSPVAPCPCPSPVAPWPLPLPVAGAQCPAANRLGFVAVRGWSLEAGSLGTIRVCCLAHLSFHGLGQLGLVKKNLGQNILGMPGHIGAYPWRRRWSTCPFLRINKYPVSLMV